jgi:arylformamidase
MADTDAATAGLYYPEAAGYAERVLARAEGIYRRGAVERDLRYGAHSRQVLDVFLPEAGGRSGHCPLLAFFHGGGWMNGQKEWMAFMAPAVVRIPAVFVTIFYRLAPTFRWPLMGEDCVAALSWTARNAARFGADPDRIFVGGHSAGAHLAAHVAVRAGSTDAGFRIRGCLPISGTFDMRFGETAPGSMEHRIQTLVLGSPADADDASPLAGVRSATPPFLIACGEHDFPRIRRNAAMMADALAAAGVRHETVVLPGADHFAASEVCVDAGSLWLEAAQRWIGDQGLGS